MTGPSLDLSAYGITGVGEIVYNPSYEKLFEEETKPGLEGFERGTVTTSGAVAVDTGIFTGRSPKDKYLVRDDVSRDTVWWADQGKGKNDNKPITPEVWAHLKSLVTKQLSNKRLFVIDAFCGANVARVNKIISVHELMDSLPKEFDDAMSTLSKSVQNMQSKLNFSIKS